jgi:TolA-binding protein
MRFVVRSVLFVALSMAWAPAMAQIDSREGIALQNQIYQLRQQLQQLQSQGGGGYAPRAPAYAPQAPQYSGSGGGDLLPLLLTRVDQLEDQVRQLRGRLDETQNQVQQMNLDLNKKIDDLAFQMGQQGGSAPQAAQPPQQRPAAPALPTPPPPVQRQEPSAPRASGPRTPEMALQEGNAALARRDYTTAEAAAREALSNRTSPRAYDAKLLLAQALQGEKQYPQAAVAFDDAYNASRKGSHAQDALLGLASSLASIKENKAACDTLNRLRSDFPQLRPDIRDGAAATAQRASCR